MSSRPIIVALSLALVLPLLGSCGEEGDGSLFSTDLAKGHVETFLVAVDNEDFARALKMCKAPFRYRDRTWGEDVLAKNLERVLKEMLAEIRRTRQVEAFSTADLNEGRWPRQEEVPEGERAVRMARYGLAGEGFLVRAYPERGKGILFTVLVDGPSLRISGMFP